VVVNKSRGDRVGVRIALDRLTALADPTRSRLLLLLDRHELTEGNLARLDRKDLLVPLAEAALRRGALRELWKLWRDDPLWQRRAAAAELDGLGPANEAIKRLARFGCGAARAAGGRRRHL